MYNNKDLTHMGVAHSRQHRRIKMGNSLVKLPLTSPRSCGCRSRSRTARPSIPSADYSIDHMREKHPSHISTRGQEGRWHETILALVKSLEDPPSPRPLLQPPMEALHGFNSACSKCGWRSVVGPYHGGVPPYLHETSSNTKDERT